MTVSYDPWGAVFEQIALFLSAASLKVMTEEAVLAVILPIAGIRWANYILRMVRLDRGAATQMGIEFLILLAITIPVQVPQVGVYNGNEPPREILGLPAEDNSKLFQDLPRTSLGIVFLTERVNDVFYQLLLTLSDLLKIQDHQAPNLMTLAMASASEANISSRNIRGAIAVYAQHCYGKVVRSSSHFEEANIFQEFYNFVSNKFPELFSVESDFVPQSGPLKGENLTCQQLKQELGRQIDQALTEKQFSQHLNWVNANLLNDTLADQLHYNNLYVSMAIANLVREQEARELEEALTQTSLDRSSFVLDLAEWIGSGWSWLESQYKNYTVTGIIPIPGGKSASEAFEFGHRRTELRSIINIISGLLLCGIYLYAGIGSILIFLIPSKSLSLVIWFVTLLAWIKSWPLGWLLIDRLYNMVVFAANNESFLRMQNNIDPAVAISITDQVAQFQSLIEVLYWSVPIATAFFLKVPSAALNMAGRIK